MQKKFQFIFYFNLMISLHRVVGFLLLWSCFRCDKGLSPVTSKQMATLYGRDYKTISKHINNALKEELAGSEEVVANFATTTQHGAMKDRCDKGLSPVTSANRCDSLMLRYD